MSDREIGSEFHFFLSSVALDFSDEWHALYPPGRRFYLTSGRAALRAVARVLALNPSTPVLMPAYCCPEMLMPLREVGAPIVYYPVREDLKVRLEDIKKRQARHAKLLALIHYFGFPQEDTAEIIAWCRQRGIRVVEDLAQAFLTTVEGIPLGRFADFTVNSFRKMIPLPDGAVLTASDERLAAMIEPARSVHALMFGAARSFAMFLKTAYERQSSTQLKRLSKYWFSLSEDYLIRDREPAPMSLLGQALLTRINPLEVIQSRRQNYLILLNALQGLDGVKPVFPTLPEGVCPLGFPITAAARDALRETLIEERIYPPVHWALDPTVNAKEFPAARRLSRRILTLPCDQRYNAGDMRRIAEITKDFTAKKTTAGHAGD